MAVRADPVGRRDAAFREVFVECRADGFSPPTRVVLSCYDGARTGGRSGTSGSLTIPVSSSGPCATRTATGGASGARPATIRNAARTSSGRTAGVTCRTTTSSIARPPMSVDRRTRPFGAAPAAPRTSTLRRPSLVSRSTASSSCGRAGPGRLVQGVGVDAGEFDRASARPRSVRRAIRAGRDDLDDVQPVRQRGVERPRGSAPGRRSRARPISRYSASLATPVGEAPDVADLRMRA